MVKDLFQQNFTLNFNERILIGDELDKRGLEYPHCSACSSKTDIHFLRKTAEESLNKAMCLPCFLLNHTDADQESIDRMVKIGEQSGMYKD